MKRGRAGKTTAGAEPRSATKRARSAVPFKRRVPKGISSASVFQGVPRAPEKKFLDVTTASAIAFGSTAGVAPILLNGCAQGVDATQHIGRTTVMTSLEWKLEGNLAPTTTGTSPIRLHIVYDKEAEGVAPTIGAGAQTDFMAIDSIYSVNNLNNRDRFITLVDEVIESIGTAGPQSFFRQGYRKVKLPCVFNASAAATVAAINTGSVYATLWQNGSLLVANVPFVLQTRIRFQDA